MKGAIVEMTYEAFAMLVSGKVKLPQGIGFMVGQPEVRKNTLPIRLVGEALPAWAETPEGGCFPWAALETDNDGNVLTIKEG